MARRSLTRPPRTAPLRFFAALLALAALLAYIALSLGSFFDVREVELPDLIGLEADEAARVLRTLGLEPLTFSEAAPNAPTNTVTSQSPRAGAVVREGRSVSLGISAAGEALRAPNLLGGTQAQAAALLAGTSARIGEVSYVFSDAPEGQIVEQRPAGGETLEANGAIDLVVSRGPEVATVAVPDLRGVNIDAAKNRLRSLGFNNVDTLAASVSFDRPFTVTDQTPQRGQEVPVSTRVTLFYALSTDTVVSVPELSGLPLSRAQLLLRASGLLLGGVSYVDDPAQPAGVVAAEPQGYTLRNTPVTLTVNRSGSPQPLTGDLGLSQPEPLEPTPASPSFGDAPSPAPGALEPETGQLSSTPNDGRIDSNQRDIPFNFDPRNLGMTTIQNNPYKFTLVVRDERGERTVLETVVPAGEAVTTTVTVYGEALLQTYLNDIFYQAWNP